MTQDTPSRHLDKFMLRMPDGMRERIAKIAEANGRSMNAEIVARLTQSLALDQSIEAATGEPLKGITALCEQMQHGIQSIAMLALEAGIKNGDVEIQKDRYKREEIEL